MVDNELGHWVPPWEKLPYNNPTRNPLARSYSFVKTAKLLGYLNLIIFSFMINNGTFDSLAAPQLGLAAEEIRTQLISTPSYLYLVGGLERVFAIAVQLGLSVLVFYSVKRQEARLYWLAVLLHMLVNLPAVLLVSAGVGIVWIELWVAICAAVAVWYVIRSQRQEKQHAVLAGSAEMSQNG